MSILPKAIYTSWDPIESKFQWYFFPHRNRTNNTKICEKPQKIPDSQSNLEKKNKGGGIKLPDFKLYYKTIVIKQYHTHMKMDTYINRIELRAQKYVHVYVVT